MNLEEALSLARREFVTVLAKSGVEFKVNCIDGNMDLSPSQVMDYLEDPDATLAEIRGVSLEDYLRWKEYVYDGHTEVAHTIPLREFLANPPKARNNHENSIPLDLRWEVWERDNFTCLDCGTRRDLTIDHIIPVSKGGRTVKDNLQTLCRSCNSKKGSNG